MKTFKQLKVGDPIYAIRIDTDGLHFYTETISKVDPKYMWGYILYADGRNVKSKTRYNTALYVTGDMSELNAAGTIDTDSTPTRTIRKFADKRLAKSFVNNLVKELSKEQLTKWA